MTFEGFGEYAVEFYDGLGADNSKAYWSDHEAVYRADVRAPMDALLGELVGEFGPGFGEAKVFRPHRDVRFSKEKHPYKTHCGGVIESGRGAGAYYVEVSSAGLRVGGGCYHLAADQLARYRTAVTGATAGEPLVGIIDTLRRKGFDIGGDVLKTRPRGVDPEHPRLELLRHRSLHAMKTWPPDDTLHEPGALRRVRTAWRALRPFNEWARDHVGASDLPRR